MKTIIALDLGTTTGFAVQSKHGLSHGTISFKKKGKWDDSGYKALYDWLRTFEGEIEVVIEKAHVSRFLGAARILFGLRALVCVYCAEFSVRLTEVSPLTIKKFWTGSGKAKKEDMVAQTQKKFPKVKDHNQSDAIALLHYYLENK